MASSFKGTKFCKDCNNMLYPVEKRIEDENSTSYTGSLMFRCRICGYAVPAKPFDEHENCVYNSDMRVKTNAITVEPSLIKDPTLQRTTDAQCTRCSHNEAVAHCNVTKERMDLVFICVKCGNHWRKEDEEISEDSDDDQ